MVLEFFWTENVLQKIKCMLILSYCICSYDFTIRFYNKNCKDAQKNCTILHGNLLKFFFEFINTRARMENIGFSASMTTLGKGI